MSDPGEGEGRLLVPIQELMRTRELWSELSTGCVEHVVPRQHLEGTDGVIAASNAGLVR